MTADAPEVLLGLGCLFLYFTLETHATPGVFCKFNGTKYKAGESWHPYLEPHGLMVCILCTCSESTNVSCSYIQCPILQCRNPIKDPDQCCSKCPEQLHLSGSQVPDNSSCQHNGTTYQHGDIFTDNDPLPSRQSNQCTQCSCSEGHIYCRLVTCPELLCPSPQTTPDSCCRVCRDSSSEKLTEEPDVIDRGVAHSQYQCRGMLRSKGTQGVADSPTRPSLEFIPKRPKQKGASGGTTVRIILKEKHKKACVYRGKTYSHGEVWHPTIPRIEVMSCILCTCRDGNQDCGKITCPKEYPCEEPEHVEGKCCKVCPEEKVIPAGEMDTTRCGVSVYMFVPPSTPQNPKENLRKIAIEREASEDVEIYMWKPVKGIFHLIQIKKVKKQEFSQEVQNFRLVSRTNEAYWNMFLVQGPEAKTAESPDKETKNL